MVVANERVLELMIEDVETTPLTELVAMLPLVVKLFDEMIEVVAETPLTTVVKILPVTD